MRATRLRGCGQPRPSARIGSARLVTYATLAWLVSGACQPKLERKMDQEFERVRHATFTHHSRNLTIEGTRREQYATSWRWRFETDEQPRDYATALLRVLGNEYDCRENHSSLECSRTLSGDLALLSLRFVRLQGVTAVQAELKVVPD
jgi:hypothetical protein